MGSTAAVLCPDIFQRIKQYILVFSCSGRPNNIEMHPNIGQLYQRKISEISHLLSDQASWEEAISLIRSLIERIDITPGEKRGQPQVQLVGGLAAILEFAVAKQQKTAIQVDSGFGRVLMVAGAGFAEDPTIAMWV
jgi:hypothetical protein